MTRLLIAAALLGGLPVAASAEPVDIELVLAVDVSLSMSPMELDIQRKGYAAALTHDRVLQAIAEGVHGKIAVTYFEWAGATSHTIVVPWTIIANRQDAELIAWTTNPVVANANTYKVFPGSLIMPIQLKVFRVLVGGLAIRPSLAPLPLV